jgi:hypothetical protein
MLVGLFRANPPEYDPVLGQFQRFLAQNIETTS